MAVVDTQEAQALIVLFASICNGCGYEIMRV